MRNKIKFSQVKPVVFKYKLWIAIILVLLLGNVFMTIQTAATGVELAKLEENYQKLSGENRVLSDKLVNDSSLTSVSKRAEELGFVKPSELLYLKPLAPVAQIP